MGCPRQRAEEFNLVSYCINKGPDARPHESTKLAIRRFKLACALRVALRSCCMSVVLAGRPASCLRGSSRRLRQLRRDCGPKPPTEFRGRTDFSVARSDASNKLASHLGLQSFIIANFSGIEGTCLTFRAIEGQRDALNAIFVLLLSRPFAGELIELSGNLKVDAVENGPVDLDTAPQQSNRPLSADYVHRGCCALVSQRKRIRTDDPRDVSGFSAAGTRRPVSIGRRKDLV